MYPAMRLFPLAAIVAAALLTGVVERLMEALRESAGCG